MKLGIVFRKYDRKSYEEMRVQAFNLIAAVTKKSNSAEVIEYNVEKDPGRKRQYHSHFMIDEACLSQLKKESERVLKASNWFKDYTVNSHLYSNVEVLKSAYGELRIHACPEVSGFLEYIKGATKPKAVKSYYYIPKALHQKIKEDLPF